MANYNNILLDIMKADLDRRIEIVKNLPMVSLRGDTFHFYGCPYLCPVGPGECDYSKDCDCSDYGTDALDFLRELNKLEFRS